MLDQLNCNKKDFTKQYPWLQRVCNSSNNKQVLIDMAKKRERRPACKKNRLGRALVSYTCPHSRSYDAEFTNKIKQLAPNWFETRSGKLEKNKKELLEMAKRGEPRPNYKKDILGRYLVRCTNSCYETFDAEFTNKIKQIVPRWFKTQFERAAEKKKELLEMAKRGEPRPVHKKDRMANQLTDYTCTSSKSHDAEFTNKIKQIAPHWFETRSERAAEKKKELLEMARRGEPRSSCSKNKLGKNLVSYTCLGSTSYDAEFTKKIRQLAPHWFRDRKAA
ncbi:MAG: hypothetical protein EBU93_04540 [Chlamydiae bacterium]|nr:hypothetical protein [Chlamydiota bacterium]